MLHAVERHAPKGRDPIDWKLITDLPINSRHDAVKKLRWYALRWKIETFHKILKSGCRAEDSKLRTAERLVHFLAILCIVGWRVFWLTTLRRTAPLVPLALTFTPLEIDVLTRAMWHVRTAGARRKPQLGDCVTRLACLGGYLNRASDAPPGNTVVWRGTRRLTVIAIGYALAHGGVGN